MHGYELELIVSINNIGHFEIANRDGDQIQQNISA